MKDFIKSHPILKHSVICRQIGWSQSSFKQWLDGHRPIPEDKELLLEDLLIQYGYEPEEIEGQ